MLLAVSINPPGLFNSIHELVRMAFPHWEVKSDPAARADGRISMLIEEADGVLILSGQINTDEKNLAYTQKFSLAAAADKNNEIKRLVRVYAFELLCRFLDRRISDYGILSGVRPLKIIHRLLDSGQDRQQIKSILTKKYLVSDKKATYLLDVAQNNRDFLLSREKAARLVSIYIGIPYCPSRCYYCSFPGAILKNYPAELLPFLEVLHEEMKLIGQYLQNGNYKVQSIYIGGGTPGILAERDLEILLALVNKLFVDESYCEEITVEAGRPDTLNLEKLKIMRRAGVSRICINPQSMNEATLLRIGRRHTAQQVYATVDLARKAGIPIINMDLIVGLEGEGSRETQNTIQQVACLRPENITLHTLAVKKGSLMAEAEGRSQVGIKYKEVAENLENMQQKLTESGYIPYYMYRQKYMRANLENTGYTLPGKQCIYNIQMMEERQTIIGLGGGAGSKFVNPADWSLTNFHNPKDPATYIANMPVYVRAKVDKLNSLN